ncbi:MAG: DevR family CRISPR-associated autoregulator [Pseudomonadota bacterium]
MSKHLFGLVVTPYGTAANNRGENEGNITTLQKILWNGEMHTTVSAESIRWALRYSWQRKGIAVNRVWNDETSDHEWRDQMWLPWTDPDGAGNGIESYVDDDVLGFMLAEAADSDGSDTGDGLSKEKAELDKQYKAFSKDGQKSDAGKELKRKIKDLDDKIKLLKKGTCNKRRGALEVSRAISLTPFAGDITFNAKSGTKTNTSLYGTEVHATRYQYGIALTPESLRVKSRGLDVVDAVTSLSEVAGNHSRFLYDFSPEAVVYRWTDDFAPRMLYGFSAMDAQSLSVPAILGRIKQGDINASELIVGAATPDTFDSNTMAEFESLKVKVVGIKAAADEVKTRMREDLKLTAS